MSSDSLLPLQTYQAVAENIARHAGAIIRAGFQQLGGDVLEKSCSTDLVTETDQKTEAYIKQELTRHFPTHKFIGEESVAGGAHCELTDAPTWIVDPLDGTTNFVHRFPMCCVSIGLTINKEPVVGVVYNPIMDKMYSGAKGLGSTVNAVPLRVSKTVQCNKAIVATEYGNNRDDHKLTQVISNFRRLAGRPSPVHSIRSLGSAALNMSMVAEGAMDAYYEFGIHCWDICAGIVLVREAGGVAVSPLFRNADTKEFEPLDLMAQRILVAASHALAEDLVSRLEPVDTEHD